MTKPEFTSPGWGAVSSDLSGIPVTYTTKQNMEGSGDEAPGSTDAVPDTWIQAFLRSHNAQGLSHEEVQQLASAASLEAVDEADPEALRSISSSHQQPLHNPFAAAAPSSSSGRHTQQQHQQQQQPPQAPDITTRLPNKQASVSSGGRINPKTGKPRKTLLKRLLRALMITGASAGLLAAGAWAGTAAYSHYMAQLDDREQLARRVAELRKQEDKLVHRCTALEQDRAGLQDSVANLTAAASEGEAARGKLKRQLGQMQADRDEAIRLNLKLQGKLTSLEEAHAGLSASLKETQAELERSRAEASRLGKEAGQLAAVVEKLEGRCASLEASRSELQRENAAH